MSEPYHSPKNYFGMYICKCPECKAGDRAIRREAAKASRERQPYREPRIPGDEELGERRYAL